MDELQQIVRAFLFTDLVGSTDLKQRLGDSEAARLISAHNALFRRCLAQYEGREESNPGDGFFATFEVPSQAVLCGLSFLRLLARDVTGASLQSRVGLHLGQTIRVQDSDAHPGGAALLGLAVDTAARIMSLAEPGQILLTRSAFDSVRQYVQKSPDGEAIEWLAHGPYRLTGVLEPIDVFEVGIRGFSPLIPPRDSQKARRVLSPEDADTVGWRPAAGQKVPGREGWVLERKLGEGGFGEAWLGYHRKMRDKRVFKFCFQADRLRALKREIVLFRVLRESLGERSDIARILDWHIDSPPHYLESEYASGGSLPDWAESKGGLQELPLPVRLEIVARTAEAVAAAHAVGVLHRDIKPTNILVAGYEDGAPRVRLTDFGIGLITRDVLEAKGIALSSMPSSVLADKDSSSSGTRMYMAPELMGGAPVSTYSDIYSLGVVLYQLVICDLRKPIGVGWERSVEDPLLREDISACIDGEPTNRLASAADLANRLRMLDERRAELDREKALQEEAVRARASAAKEGERRRRQSYQTSLILTVFAAAAMLLGGYEARHSGQATEAAQAALTDQTVQMSRAAAHWVAGTIKTRIEDAKRSVKGAAESNRLRAAVGSADSLSLDDELAWLGGSQITSWVVSDLDGKLLGSYPRLPDVERRELSVAARPWFQATVSQSGAESEALLSEPFQSVYADHRAVVAVSALVRSVEPSGTPSRAGVVMATVDIEELTNLIRSTPLYPAAADREATTENLHVVVANQSGILVVHPNNPLTEAGTPQVWSGVDTVKGSLETEGSVPLMVDPLLGQGEFYFGARRLESSNWLVTVLVPKRVALRPINALVQHVRQVRTYFLLMICGTLAMAIGAALLFAREQLVRKRRLNGTVDPTRRLPRPVFVSLAAAGLATAAVVIAMRPGTPTLTRDESAPSGTEGIASIPAILATPARESVQPVPSSSSVGGPAAESPVRRGAERGAGEVEGRATPGGADTARIHAEGEKRDSAAAATKVQNEADLSAAAARASAEQPERDRQVAARARAEAAAERERETAKRAEAAAEVERARAAAARVTAAEERAREAAARAKTESDERERVEEERVASARAEAQTRGVDRTRGRVLEAELDRAAAEAGSSRRQALGADASRVASDLFGRGSAKQAEAHRLANSGNLEAAIASQRAAADYFKQAQMQAEAAFRSASPPAKKRPRSSVPAF